jgi:hypothetical protein
MRRGLVQPKWRGTAQGDRSNIFFKAMELKLRDPPGNKSLDNLIGISQWLPKKN